MKQNIEKVYTFRLRANDIIDILNNVKNFQNADFETKSLIMSFKAIFLDNPSWKNKYLDLFRNYADIIGYYTEYGSSFVITFSEEMPKELKEKLVYKGRKIIDKMNQKRHNERIDEQLF